MILHVQNVNQNNNIAMNSDQVVVTPGDATVTPDTEIDVDEEVAKAIGADWLIYQTLEDLIDSVREGNPEIKEFETSIFTGDYFTPLIENYLEELEISRKDELKMQREKAQAKR